jgi:hypothetical protein
LGLRVAGLDLEDGAVRAGGVFEPPRLLQGVAEVRERARVPRSERDRPLVGGDRLVDAPSRALEVAQVERGLGDAVVAVGRPRVVLRGGVQLALRLVRERQVVHRERERGVELDGALQGGDAPVGVPRLSERPAQVRVVHGDVWRPVDRLADEPNREGQVPALPSDDAREVQGVGVLRLLGQHALVGPRRALEIAPALCAHALLEQRRHATRREPRGSSLVLHPSGLEASHPFTRRTSAGVDLDAVSIYVLSI